MREGQHEERPEVRQVYVSDTIGVTVKEGLVIDINGPDTSGIRVSDSLVQGRARRPSLCTEGDPR